MAPQTSADPWQVIDDLERENEELRRCLSSLDGSGDDSHVEDGDNKVDKTQSNRQTITISTVGLSDSEKDELRLLVAKFADGSGGGLDTRVCSDNEEVFLLQRGSGQWQQNVAVAEPILPLAKATCAAAESPLSKGHVDDVYRWLSKCSSGDDQQISRTMELAANAADNLFERECRCCSSSSARVSEGSIGVVARPHGGSIPEALPRTPTPSSLPGAEEVHVCKASIVDTLSHLHALGVSLPPLLPGMPHRRQALDSAAAATFPWIPIRLLYSLAQIHSLDMSLGFFTLALRRYSRLLEVSSHGEVVRLKSRHQRVRSEEHETRI